MTRSVALFAALTLLTAPASAKAEDAFTIKSKEAAQGDTVQVEKQSTHQSTFKVTDGQGNGLQNKSESKSEKFTYQETVMEKQPGQKKATRLRRRYTKAEIGTGAGDYARILPYEGKAVLIEKQGDRYRFQLESGKELTGKNAEELDKEFNKHSEEIDFNRIALPKKPVKLNESWDIEMEDLIRDFERVAPFELDEARAKGSGKLVKAYKRDGRQFGIIDFRLEFPMRALKMGEQKLALEEGAMLVLAAKVDTCIDGSLTSSRAKFIMNMEGHGELSQGDRKVKLSVTAKAQGQETERELTKK
jgi:hypothetical protein